MCLGNKDYTIHSFLIKGKGYARLKKFSLSWGRAIRGENFLTALDNSLLDLVLFSCPKQHYFLWKMPWGLSGIISKNRFN
jgi:hypothetical protein